MEIVVRPGQVWGDSDPRDGFGRELTVKHVDSRYAYCIGTDGRRTRVLLRRMKPRRNGYYLKAESSAHYVQVPSEEGLCVCGHHVERHGGAGCLSCPPGSCNAFQAKQLYDVWTGDLLSPSHCPCENFRWAKRHAGEVYLCKHLKFVLKGEGMI